MFHHLHLHHQDHDHDHHQHRNKNIYLKSKYNKIRKIDKKCFFLL